MKRLTLSVAVLIAAFSIAAFGQSSKAAKVSKASQTAVRLQRSTPELGGEVAKSPQVDGDQAYKANCLRCHWEPRKFSERATVTILRHMRVRANLTEEETDAIVRYLTR